MKSLLTYLTPLLLLVPLSAYSDSNTDHDYWQCIAEDEAHNQWNMLGKYEKEAINKAYDACKKQSQNPRSCISATTLCEHYINGHSTKPMWQCTAIDQAAAPWDSNIYPNRDDAALAAQAYCKSRSTLAASCYINLSTCRNLNEQP